MDGKRTLLIDGDLCKPDLSRTISLSNKGGLFEILQCGYPAGDLIVTLETQGNLMFLPSTAAANPIRRSELLGSQAMIKLLRSLEQSTPAYDYIVIDLPSFKQLPTAAIQHLSAWLLVTEWGKTSRDQVRTVLSDEYLIHESCIGVVLNKVKLSRLPLYSVEL
jgi:Mrp family chromosome partitioning ATPase